MSASDDPDDDDPHVASSLATISRVAILDVDYHFGNGTASIFWDDPDVFFASVHADTEGDYPWCGGRASDAGGGRGQGKTLCEPLPRGATWDAEYKPALARALAAIARHDPSVLVVSLGLDAHEADPVQERATAGIALTLAEYREMGRMIGECAAGKVGSNGEGTVGGGGGGGCSATTPVAFVQEGGYDAEHAGAIVAETFRGFEEGFAADEWERGDDAEVIAREVFAKVVIARGGRSGGGGAGGEEGGRRGEWTKRGTRTKRGGTRARRRRGGRRGGDATREIAGTGVGGSAGATKEAKEASGAAGTPARGGAPAKAPEREGAAAAAAAGGGETGSGTETEAEEEGVVRVMMTPVRSSDSRLERAPKNEKSSPPLRALEVHISPRPSHDARHGRRGQGASAFARRSDTVSSPPPARSPSFVRRRPSRSTLRAPRRPPALFPSFDPFVRRRLPAPPSALADVLPPVFPRSILQALRRAKDALAKDRKSRAVADALDLTNLIAKATNGTLDDPSQALHAIRSAWQSVRASTTDDRASTSPDPAALADALLATQQFWREEGLPGTVLDERDFAMHVATVDRKSVKAALSSMLTWSKKNRWDGFVPAVRALRDDAARKTDSPHRTYGQVVDALLALRRAAEEALEEEREDSDSDSDSDSDAEGRTSSARRVPRGPRAVGVGEVGGERAPGPQPPGGGDAHGFGGDAGALGGPESPGSRGRARRAAVGGKGLRRDGGAKRPRYEDPATDDEFEDEDRGDGSAHDERKRRKAAASERPTSTHVVGGSARVAFEIDGGGSGGFGFGSGSGPLPPGATLAALTPDAVNVTVLCHGLRATATLRRVVDEGANPNPAATRPDPPPPRVVSVDASLSSKSGSGSDLERFAAREGRAAASKPSLGVVATSASSPIRVERWVEGQNERCGRHDGKTWRCKMAAVPGMSFCAHHRAKTGGGLSAPNSPSPSPSLHVAKQKAQAATRPPAEEKEKKLTAPRRKNAVSIRILTVAGAAVNPPEGRASRADAFEAHAFDVSRAVADAGGPRATRAHPNTNREEGEEGRGAPPEDAYFRANARVFEREGTWTPFEEYEAKLLGAADAHFEKKPETAAAAAARTREVANGDPIAGSRRDAVGGTVVGCVSRDAAGALVDRLREEAEGEVKRASRADEKKTRRRRGGRSGDPPRALRAVRGGSRRAQGARGKRRGGGGDGRGAREGVRARAGRRRRRTRGASRARAPGRRTRGAAAAAAAAAARGREPGVGA